MEFGIENFHLTRRPRFAGTPFTRSDGTPFQSSSVNVDLEKTPIPLIVKAPPQDCYESRRKDPLQFKSTFSSFKAESSEILGDQYESQRNNRGISEPKHTLQEKLEPEGRICVMEINSTQKHLGSAKKPALLRRLEKMKKITSLVEKTKTRRGFAAQRRSVGNRTPLSDAMRSVRKGPNLSRLPRPNPLPSCSSSKVNIGHLDMGEEEPFQECCRALCFDDEQKVQDSEDFTAPLDMMNMTTMIVGDSILKENSLYQKVPYPQNINKSKSTTSLSSDNVKNDAHVDTKFPVDTVTTSDYKVIRDRRSTSHLPHPKIHANSNASVKENNHDSDRKLTKNRIFKRRSAIPSVKQTPKFQASKISKTHSLSKHAKIAESKYSQRKRKSVTKTDHQSIRNLRSTVATDLPEIIINQPESDKENEKAKEVSDASTNTHFAFSFGSSPKKDLVKEVESLLKDQELICQEAKLIQEQTVRRRKNMETSGLLESYMVSVSPLKRLHSLVKDKASYVNDLEKVPESVNDSIHYEDESVFFKDSDMDITMVENAHYNENLNLTGDLYSSHLKWKHLNLNSRVFQTPSSRPKKTLENASPCDEHEKFDNKIEEELSPFTEMVGDIERPSLAPMTPHSQHQVNILKMSLRKQLDQLYES